ncbi:MAG: sulfur carrier protein ThiS [Thermacetogeniaceae bacterium]|jgi:thiamine biosynthesis protein ThiS
MEILINNGSVKLREETDLLALVRTREEYVENQCIVVLNGKVVPKEKYAHILLRNGDEVLVVPGLLGG